MNRIDRLFGILLRLQRRTRVRAQDLARHFEVSERTIYRDIAALYELGVPIISLPGEGYALMEGYYLRPLVFTPGEAGALVLGARMLTSQAAGNINADAEQALAKLLAVLPQDTRHTVERLAELIQFALPPARFNLDDSRLAVLRQAIVERRVVWLRYHSYNHDQTTERQIEPFQLSYGSGAWYVSGYCRLRQAERAFRLERIETLQLLDELFTPRELQQQPAEQVTARVRFTTQAARWVRERQHYAFQHEEVGPDGAGVIMTYRLDSLAELVPWLLSWGASAEPLEPAELRESIRQEVTRLAELLT